MFTVAQIVKLLQVAEPAVKAVVVDLLSALNRKDEAATRAATEAALRLQFEARQDVAGPKPAES